LLDRFDLRIEVLAPDPDASPGPSSTEVRARVIAAIARQAARLAETPWTRNAHVPGGAIEQLLPLPTDVAGFWRGVCRGRRLSGRGAVRIRRVARTIADLDDRAEVTTGDIEVASALREDFA
jgi:magnesium chelatase family protein